MTYRILVDDRKEIVKKLEELAGRKPDYTRMPRCAYILDGIAVEKDGTVTTQEDADTELVRQLMEAGLIGEMQETETEQETPELVQETTSEESEEQAEEPDTEEAEEPSESAEETSVPEPLKPDISLPLSGHRADSVCNLVYTIYSRGKLLSKSTGGCFCASQELVDRLQTEKILTVEDALRIISEYADDGLSGLSFEDGKVVFDGFPETTNPAEIRAWTVLTAAINKTAIKQKHIYAKEVDDTNEKFAFRTWLTRLGLNGADMKAERSILYKNLSGHTAFRTEKDQEKWMARQKAKRQALRDLKEGTQAEG